MTPSGPRAQSAGKKWPTWLSRKEASDARFAPDKRYVALAEGTHTIIMERNRMRLFRAVQSFLEKEPRS